jgi:glycosyltransferase involved in cell wall biosynthesis
MNILYVLPVKGGGGGAHSVAQEVDELNKIGLNVRIAVNANNYPKFITTYYDMPRVINNVVSYTNDIQLAKLMVTSDVTVCTIFTSVELVKQALTKIPNKKPQIAYYIQDYEPLFSEPEDPLWRQAYDSYTLIPKMTLFAKTHWIMDVVQRNHSVVVNKVNPSIDHSVYYPNLKRSGEVIWLAAMVRPASPRRAPNRTMRILKKISEEFSGKVVINIFGCDDEAIIDNDLPRDFKFHNHGVLLREQVAALLRKNHMFIDLSDYQAFGRTGLEAMACGAVSIVPSLGGTNEYVLHGDNSYAVDPRDEALVLSTIRQFIELPELDKEQIKNKAIETAQGFSVNKAALSVYKLLSKFL